MLIIVMVMTILVLFSAAGLTADETPNYCHDTQVDETWREMLSKSPNDLLIIKLYGLREGLCKMIDNGLISHKQGTDIWNDEHSKSVVERFQDEQKAKNKFHL